MGQMKRALEERDWLFDLALDCLNKEDSIESALRQYLDLSTTQGADTEVRVALFDEAKLDFQTSRHADNT